MEKFDSACGLRFLSELGALKSLALDNVTPDLASEDLAGCTSLQKLRLVMPVRLVDIHGAYNMVVRTLDVSTCPSLLELDCSKCSISVLDMSKCTSLRWRLDCSDNKLRILELPDHTNLTELRCGSNDLLRLDVNSSTALEVLACHENINMSSLQLPSSTRLRNLACNWTLLSSLDVSRFTALQRLSCGNIELTSLDVSGCSSLQLLDFVFFLFFS